MVTFSLKKTLFILSLAGSFVLTGCSTAGKIDPFADKSAEQIYGVGYRSLERGDYETAIKAYQGLESHYPFGEYTKQGQLDIIYAYYKFEEQPAAIFAADRFIRLHPRFPQLDYVYYMKGVAKFSENISLLERMFPLDPTRRDISSEREAFALFSDFLRRYPDSKYANDAKQRMIYLRNSLAEHELHVARYYMTRQAYIAAANRAQTIIQQYSRAAATEPALRLLVEAYDKAGLTQLSEQAKQTLELNYKT